MRFPTAAPRHEHPPTRAFPAPSLVWVWLFAFLLAVASFGARGDDDLPGRVGRIAEFAGQLYLSPEDRATEWEPIGLNYPVTSGDNLWVSGDGRAEIDYGGGQFRLAGDTNLHVSRLDDRQLALFLAQGRIIVRVRVLDTGDATRVDTPNTQVTLTRPGLYRIEVTPDRQQTTVTVREGEALVGLTNGAQQALPGQTASVFGPDPADAEVRNNVGMDGFDTWSANRDRRYERGRSTAYVSRQMVGYADLDEYGTWQTYPEYGAVWFPTTVAVGWAPYRDGYWANVGGWGYTWVDHAPWGYAPFHYGRWAFVGGRWGWCPGTYVARPVWAPALVGWFGGGGWGMSLNVGVPVYGWVPLGWGEAYLPWWRRCSNNCWTHHNRPYNVNVRVRPTAPPPRYTHVGVPGAITAVSATTITSRRPIPANLVQIPPSLATAAPVMATAPTVTLGPAPVARVQPGVGAAPRPASTFVPSSRTGNTDGGDRSRPPSAGAGSTSGTAPGGSPRAGFGETPSRRPPAPRPEPQAGPAPAPATTPGAGAQPTGSGGPAMSAGTRAPEQRAGPPPVATSPPATVPVAPPASSEAPPPSTPRRSREIPTVPGASAAPGPAGGQGSAVPVPAEPRSQGQPRRQRESPPPPVVQAPTVGGSASPPPPRHAPSTAPIPTPAGRGAPPSAPSPGAAAPSAPPAAAPPVPHGNARPAPPGIEGAGKSGRRGEKPDASPPSAPGGGPK